MRRTCAIASVTALIAWCRSAGRDFVDGAGKQVVSEHLAARILEAAGLPVAQGRLARTTEEAVRAASEVGYPVVLKGISPAITHRAAAGLVRLALEDDAGVAKADRAFRARAAALGVTLDGTFVQHMVAGNFELLVTAIRDPQFGVMVGCGMGGAMTEIIDDVVFARAPIDAEGAFDLIGYLRTIARLPELLSGRATQSCRRIRGALLGLVAGAPWEDFTFEINPVKLGPARLAAVGRPAGDRLSRLRRSTHEETVYPPPQLIETEIYARMPAELHRTDKYSAWVERRGAGPLHSFLEGPSFDRAGNLYCVDLAHGRIFRIAPDQLDGVRRV